MIGKNRSQVWNQNQSNYCSAVTVFHREYLKAQCNRTVVPPLAILDEKAVIIHGHSVKGIERVIRCCNKNANVTSSD